MFTDYLNKHSIFGTGKNLNLILMCPCYLVNFVIGGIIGLGEAEDDRVGLLHTLATLPTHPESVPINALLAMKGTPLEEQKVNALSLLRCTYLRARNISSPLSILLFFTLCLLACQKIAYLIIVYTRHLDNFNRR